MVATGVGASVGMAVSVGAGVSAGGVSATGVSATGVSTGGVSVVGVSATGVSATGVSTGGVSVVGVSAGPALSLDAGAVAALPDTVNARLAVRPDVAPTACTSWGPNGPLSLTE